MARKLGAATAPPPRAPSIGELQLDLRQRLALIEAERDAIVAMLAELDGSPKRARKGHAPDAATSVTRPGRRFARPPKG
jgi:hypothetical protein